jgi:hypothetical protein
MEKMVDISKLWTIYFRKYILVKQQYFGQILIKIKK